MGFLPSPREHQVERAYLVLEERECVFLGPDLSGKCETAESDKQGGKHDERPGLEGGVDARLGNNYI